MSSIPKDKLPIPRHWNKDKLSAFIQRAIFNVFATFDNKKPEYAVLRDIDDIFQTIIDNLINAKDFIGAMFLLRTHSAYRAGCRLAMSGQAPETFVLLRSCLENALYALHINRNSGTGEVWAKRHDGEVCLKFCKREFTYKNVISTLQQVDADIYDITQSLYERTIDFGAHPNERALTSSMKIETDGEHKKFMQIYLTGDTPELAHALKTTAQVGLCSLYIFRHIFKERFDILGLSLKMGKLRKHL